MAKQATVPDDDLPGARTTCAASEVEIAAATHEFLKALASPTRQRIMLLFARGAELSVNEIAERAGVGQSTASQQLTLLRRGGIVTSRREGKVVLYRADREGTLAALADLQAYLENCC
ncbi:ArsR/SmtB family transcription factor [Actinopolymorpha rutila]|uniref:DNA-binding transcriptional ArsR family regulator n=1 Tax=Actinopolymorpha rutila TaxID=446787 RepID=A0A852ZHE4_9ACTN|nr:metalloregulator ArsR/SmtB family transcription factor [Actinopolymorpha rutila]NYH91072.1 DNA-binding transcriptional ArsR family regulator [Actinopolymorpha rutila]